MDWTTLVSASRRWLRFSFFVDGMYRHSANHSFQSSWKPPALSPWKGIVSLSMCGCSDDDSRPAFDASRNEIRSGTRRDRGSGRVPVRPSSIETSLLEQSMVKFARVAIFKTRTYSASMRFFFRYEWIIGNQCRPTVFNSPSGRVRALASGKLIRACHRRRYRDEKNEEESVERTDDVRNYVRNKFASVSRKSLVSAARNYLPFCSCYGRQTGAARLSSTRVYLPTASDLLTGNWRSGQRQRPFVPGGASKKKGRDKRVKSGRRGNGAHLCQAPCLSRLRAGRNGRNGRRKRESRHDNAFGAPSTI